ALAAGRTSPAHRSLYARLGGAPVVKAIVSDTVDGMLADRRLSPPFQGVNTRRTKRLIAQFICQLAGGGCHYAGVTMHEAHANLHITEAQFFGMVQILRKAMRRHHVRIRERNELLARLAPLEPDIVEVKVPPPPRAH
ncbi:MAG: group I truncated hemoglobin, partial [Steroidobacteraceae bacterium]